MRRRRPGDTVTVDALASVQFAGDRSLTMRLIRVGDPVTCDGFAWIEGYVLDTRGDAVERRTVFVRLVGLRPARQPSTRSHAA